MAEMWCGIDCSGQMWVLSICWLIWGIICNHMTQSGDLLPPHQGFDTFGILCGHFHVQVFRNWQILVMENVLQEISSAYVHTGLCANSDLWLSKVIFSSPPPPQLSSLFALFANYSTILSWKHVLLKCNTIVFKCGVEKNKFHSTFWWSSFGTLWWSRRGGGEAVWGILKGRAIIWLWKTLYVKKNNNM